MIGRNFHAVIPGRVYRCAQLSPTSLADVIQTHGIRTVVNLRGCGATLPWYLAECRMTHQLNINQEDISFSASRLPASQEVRQVIRVLDATDYPILLHCRQGADRTGLAAAIVLLLRDDVPFDQAMSQLGLRYGHIPLERARYLDRFFALYTDWLTTHGQSHSARAFRQWIEHDYCAGECRSEIELLAPPRRHAADEPLHLTLRVRNTGLTPWHFRPENNAGIHLAFLLKDAEDRGITSGRAGLYRTEVAPNQTIDLQLILPALRRAGRYRLLADMMDEQHCWFYQTGSEPLEYELEVQ
jgi:protein tyrosine phosphatase (PTP) superfamily phosphohydrolase (DUF442 family)